MIDVLYPSQQPRLAMERMARDENIASGDGLAFSALIDAVNPLQHIPVVSSLYRDASGQGISTFASLAGGALFGGPLGFATAAANSLLEAVSGRDLGGHVMAMLSGDIPSPDRAAAAYAKAATNLA